MIDLPTIAGFICAIAAINWGLVEFNGTDLVAQYSPSAQVKTYVRYLIGAAGLYFFLYCFTLAKVPKTKML